MTEDKYIKKIIDQAVLEGSIRMPQCQCPDGGIPDMLFNFRRFCKCLQCGWYISAKTIYENRKPYQKEDNNEQGK